MTRKRLPSPLSSNRRYLDSAAGSEIEFWDAVSEIDSDKHVGIPSIECLSIPFIRSSDSRFLESIGPVTSLTILEVGCGFGDLSLLLADKGADALGLDISKGMVRKARDRAESTGVPAAFMRGDSHRLPFKEASLDMVVGMRAIHHFHDIPQFYREVYRVLKPTGQAVFIEPQKMNPIVEINRKILNPEKRTRAEHPLVRKDIDDAKKVFPNVRIETFYLVSPLAFFFQYLIKSDRFHRIAFRLLQAVEGALANNRLLSSFSWQVLLVLRKN